MVLQVLRVLREVLQVPIDCGTVGSVQIYYYLGMMHTRIHTIPIYVRPPVVEHVKHIFFPLLVVLHVVEM